MRRMFSENQIKKLAQDATAESFEEIDEALEGKQDKLDANSEIVVKTLDVKNAEYSFNLEVTSSTALTYTPRYCKALVSGGVMYIIIACLFQNETEESISSGNFQLQITNIPSEVASRIICANGESVDDDFTANSNISPLYFNMKTNVDDARTRYAYKYTKGGIKFNVPVATLAPGATQETDARVFWPLF